VETPKQDQFKEDESINSTQKSSHAVSFWDASGVILMDFTESGVRIKLMPSTQNIMSTLYSKPGS